MLVMAELEKDAQLGFWSTWDIRAILDALVSEGRRHRITFRGQVLKQQHLLNAMILYMGSLPDPERVEAIRSAVETLALTLDGTDVVTSARRKTETIKPMRDRKGKEKAG